MLRPQNLYTLLCRPALPRDTPEVMELTRQIWGGEDYVPFVWADWLADLQGLLPVLEAAGFQRQWEAAVYVYEKGIEQGNRGVGERRQRDYLRKGLGHG